MNPTPGLGPSFLAELTLRRVAVTIGMAVLAAVALAPIFVTPFTVVLGRTLVIAMVLLLAFTLAGLWQPPGVPRWLAQVIVVVVAAPLATFGVYVATLGGDVGAFLRHEGYVHGFLSISATAMIVAPLIALGALYRERDAQARNQALRFALERSTLERQALDARLNLLQAQIKPHFLFNTLANVQALVESGSPQAGPVLKHLIAYLRGAVPRLNDGAATLGDEAALVRAYLELMHMRMPDRLSFTIDIPPELAGARFPAMAVLTLVENAIHHGIDPAEQGGRIDVRARRDAASGELRVTVTDTGVGMAETAAPGTGLTNLRARLQAFVPGDEAGARLELSEHAPRGVRAEIVFQPTAPAGTQR